MTPPAALLATVPIGRPCRLEVLRGSLGYPLAPAGYSPGDVPPRPAEGALADGLRMAGDPNLPVIWKATPVPFQGLPRG